MPYEQLTRVTRQLCFRTCYNDLKHILQFRYYSKQRNLGFILEGEGQSHNLTSPDSLSLCHPAARTQTRADSASLQSCSFPWAPFWAAFLEVKQTTRPRVSPSSPLLYRPEGKQVSARRGRKRGVLDAASPLWISSGKWAVELQGHFWTLKNCHYVFCF